MLKNNIPQRRCIGCLTSKDQSDLIRMTYKDGHVGIDPDGRASGRGFYLCRDIDCLEKAVKKKAFQRAVKRNVDDSDIEKIREAVKREV